MKKRCCWIFLAAAVVAVMFLSSQASGISDFGSPCKRNVDCTTGLCSNGICSTEGPCANLKLDNGETDIDCGGVCAEVKNQVCSLGKNCVESSDCKSGVCSSGGRCISQTEAKAQSAPSQKPRVNADGSAKSSGGGFAAKATLFLIILALAIFGAIAFLSYLKSRVRKIEDDLPPLRHSPGRKTPPQPQQRMQEAVPQNYMRQEQSKQSTHHHSKHAVFENLERTYSNLSGEELFDELRRKTGRK